ncbi:hypothetical protein ONZ51_g1642 [Trametes cubensis]|uniref:DUF6533 domain-containing protein n=1 Tax=Trametes cubensis TaxID=1111947 RepID=A0AAD7XEM7_9APHY|nr:hypothetical protein ONZ51_g1642 [Trametes cubensis]
MSTQEVSSIIAAYSTLATEGYVGTAACALLIYHYLTTLDEELNHYTYKFTLSTLLFIINRYIPIISLVYNLPFWPVYTTEVSLLTILNIVSLITELLNTFHEALYGNGSYIINFNEPITAILVSTFLIELRKAADSEAYQTSISSMSSLEFRVVGSIGASLSNPEPLPEGAAEEMEMVEVGHAEEGAQQLASSDGMEIEEVARSEEHVDV